MPEIQAGNATLAGPISAWAARHPVLIIWAASALALTVNCFPVIFLGRSFVAPTDGIPLVYSWGMPLPEMKPTRYYSVHGSDIAAMMIGEVPAGFVESRSVWEHGELPLWDRYGHCGYTMIGQAIFMLEDPLQWIVIIGHGSAPAWDIKFLAAKLLFCVGFGLLILRLTRSKPLAAIYAALAAYCGAFFYINAHPSFFVFCYSPWVLLSALALLDLRSGASWRAGLGWLLANVACFNGGDAEAAVTLIGGLNLAAFIFALTSCRAMGDVARVAGRMAVGTALFLGLTAPVWMTFWRALPCSYTAHQQVFAGLLPFTDSARAANVGNVYLQHILAGLVPFADLMGAFEDVFYRRALPGPQYAPPAPGTSLLVMAGSIFAALRWRELKKERFFWINSAAIFLWGGLVFGLIPAAVIRHIPLFNRVGHAYTDFSYLLVIHLTIQSAYGFARLAAARDFRRVAMDFAWIGLIAAAMLGIYCVSLKHGPLPWNYLLCVGAGAAGAPLVFAYLKSRKGRVSVLGWACVLVLGFIAQFRFGIYAFGSDSLLMIFGPRVVLNAPSDAVDWIKNNSSDPFRVMGRSYWDFFGDYAAVYGLEDIRSCAPLSSAAYINLVSHFPGARFGQKWMIKVNPIEAQPLLNLLNVRYVLTRPNVKIPNGTDYREVHRGDFGVVENPEAWPRAFFTDKVIPVSSNAQFIQYLGANGKQPFAALNSSDIAQRPALRQLENTAHATVVAADDYRLLPNSTAFDIRVPRAGIVSLAEGQAGDFIATANGRPAPVLAVNEAFKGIYLDRPGNYRVIFTYRPPRWAAACALFWGALAAAMAWAVSGLFQPRVAPGFSRGGEP